MKNKTKVIIAVIAIIGLTIAACGGGGGLSGTYSNEFMSFTFSGNKLTVEAFGQKEEGTYQIKGGKLITTSKDGETETYDYTLTGNVLTMSMGGFEYTLTKK
jgi:hypothetical protein